MNTFPGDVVLAHGFLPPQPLGVTVAVLGVTVAVVGIALTVFFCIDKPANGQIGTIFVESIGKGAAGAGGATGAVSNLVDPMLDRPQSGTIQ